MARLKISELEKVARQELGFSALRPGQEEAVRSVLEGRDTLVIQPTGSGKSAVYQAAGLLLEGATVVVSPLIALQKDQVDAIDAQPHDAEAALVNCSLRASELRETLSRIGGGAVEFVFLAPEQLRKPETLETLKQAEPSLFVVDEAHCITEWGHDFRPDYLALGGVIEELGHPTVLALTATAAPEVRQDIIDKLRLRDPRVFVRGFDRPNIALRVDVFQSEEEKLDALVRRVRFAGKPGIVYVATRRNAESIMARLKEEGIDAVFYHAGLKAKEREAIQDRFMSGGAEVIVATNAFGMGVDKSDVRFVYHYDISDSLDSYYQEIGRAGRDGEPAEAVLFYRSQDIAIRKFQAGSGKVETYEIEKVATIIEEERGPAVAKEIARQTDMSVRKVASILNRLEEADVIETDQDDVRLAGGLDAREAAQTAGQAHERLKEVRRKRVKTMQNYAELTSCRREFLLRYFGDGFSGPCGNCDNDQSLDPAAGTRREVA